MRRVILISYFFILGINTILYSQNLYKKVVSVVPDEYVGESLKYKNLFVDTLGNFCMKTRINKEDYFYTNEGLIGPFHFISSTNDISFTSDGIENNESDFWYRCRFSPNVYGPVYGELLEAATSKYGGVSILVKRKDSLYYYVNDQIVCSLNINAKQDLFGDEWCLFNHKGDYLLNVDEGSYQLIYFNGNLVDSAAYVDEFYLDENGNYIYIKSDRGRDEFSTVLMCYNSKEIFEVKDFTVGNMDASGNFYFINSHNNTEKVIFKNRSFDYPRCVDNEGNSMNDITLIRTTTESYLFVCIESGSKMNVFYNGIELGVYKNISSLNIDSNGNYAFYILKDYFLYPVINGVQGEALSRYGVRASPIHINPNGDKFVYYKTKDSIYFYRNEELIEQLSSKKNVFVGELSYDLRDYDASSYNKTTAKYLKLGEKSFYIINDIIYGPYLPISGYYSGKGAVEEAKIYDNGEFFVIQNVDERSYQFNYNGEIYSQIENVEGILKDCYYKTDKGFTFFAVSGNTIYQYSTYER